MSKVLGETKGPATPEFRALYRTTMPDVYGYALGLAGGNASIAEDVVSETYLAAVRLFVGGRSNEVTVGWLKVVARRRHVDHIRRETRITQRASLLRDELIARRSGTGGGSERQIDDREEVFKALARISEEQRLVLIMKYFDGCSVREIADQLGRTPKAIESVLTRARSAFRAAIGEVK